MTPPFFSRHRDPVLRLRVEPEEPDAFTAPRPRGSRRPHSDAKVAQVRRLIEETPLTYGQIAARSGVGRASICRWTQDNKWRRPPFAPRATDTIPRARASAQLKRRTLAARLDALAERHIRELEESGCVDAEKLAEALELLKMAKAAARPRHRPRPRASGGGSGRAPAAPMRPIIELCAADVDLHRAPRAAIEDFLEHRARPDEEPAPNRRGRGREPRRVREHRLMLERE